MQDKSENAHHNPIPGPKLKVHCEVFLMFLTNIKPKVYPGGQTNVLPLPIMH